MWLQELLLVLKSQATKAGSLGFDIFRGAQTQVVRLVCRRITNQTQQVCSLNPISRTLAASHKDFTSKSQTGSSFVSTHREYSPAEVHSFLRCLTKETWDARRDKRIQGKVPGHPKVGWNTRATESRIPSQLCSCCPCKGKPLISLTGGERGGGTTDDGAPGSRTLGFSPNPALHFPSRMETSTRSVLLPHASASRGCTRAGQNARERPP